MLVAGMCLGHGPQQRRHARCVPKAPANNLGPNCQANRHIGQLHQLLQDYLYHLHYVQHAPRSNCYPELQQATHVDSLSLL